MSTKRRSDRVKIATAYPTGMLLKRGLEPTPDPEQTAINKQIHQLRDRYFFLEARYQGLVAAFHMLKPLMKNRGLKKRLEREGKSTSVSLVATVLFESCVLDCYTILVDSQETNPSLCTLTRPFLKRNRADNSKLIDRLTNLYSEYKPYWPPASKTGVFSPEDRSKWITKNRQSNAGRRGAFRRIVNQLTSDWPKLAQASQQLPSFRTNFVAHLILRYDQSTERFNLGTTAKPSELYADIENLLPVLTRSIANLATILGIGADRLNVFERRAKKNARIFWNLESINRVRASRRETR
jgi:hypothetical protein